MVVVLNHTPSGGIDSPVRTTQWVKWLTTLDLPPLIFLYISHQDSAGIMPICKKDNVRQ
jgi:hypothetical protein